MRRAMRNRITGVLAMVLIAAGGCSIGNVRRPPDGGSPPPGPSNSAPTSPVVEIRAADVPVTTDFNQERVDFVDANRGYALFTRCGTDTASSGTTPTCAAVLLATTDGGRSWQRLRHPRSEAAEQQMIVTRDGTLLLRAAPYWYRSTDGGHAFTRADGGAEPPGAFQENLSRFQFNEQWNQIVDWRGGRARPLPVPPVPEPTSLAYRDERLWVSGTRAGRPVVALSTDLGRTWTTPSVPAMPDGDPAGMAVEIAPDGDAWFMVRPATGRPPALWRHPARAEGTTPWVPVAADGLPEQADILVPIGAGTVAVGGRSSAGVVSDGRYTVVDWPIVNRMFHSLVDGTLLAEEHEGDPLLGVGRAADRSWIRIVLQPA
ncbi:hypothetical protein [Plantactinospora sp. GCM10030261]|uniref:sialidase family protein n=1 Tax=Plantactinospora sp. GCM10030261 TaxID=3273420 RepID=UPI003610A1C7